MLRICDEPNKNLSVMFPRDSGGGADASFLVSKMDFIFNALN